MSPVQSPCASRCSLRSLRVTTASSESTIHTELTQGVSGGGESGAATPGSKMNTLNGKNKLNNSINAFFKFIIVV